MRAIYDAENLLDAHLVKGLLEEHGIAAFVSGLYLTGALGELPVAGLVSVMVSDDAVAAASEVIAALARDRASGYDDEAELA